jgi:hypothetical protein
VVDTVGSTGKTRFSIGQALLATMGGWVAVAAFLVFSSTTGPSADIARTFIPAILMIIMAVSVIVTLPATWLLAGWTQRQSRSHAWARLWLSWTLGGAAVAALIGVVLITLLSGGYWYSALSAAPTCALPGAVTGLIAYFLARQR